MKQMNADRRKRLLPIILSAFICVHLRLLAAEPMQIEAAVYYSKEDPHWTDAERILETVAQQYAPLRITKVCIDDDAGYRQLAEAEQKLHVYEPGDLTVVLSATYAAPLPPTPSRSGEGAGGGQPKTSTEQLALSSTGARREVEQCLAAVVKRLRNPDEGKGRLESDLPAFVAEVFGKGATVKAEPDDKAAHSRYYTVYHEGKRVGWIVDAFRHAGCPVCNDMQFLMAVSAPELKVLLIRPQRDLERLAVSLDSKDSQAFLDQFKGRAPETGQIRVDAISGATKTCRLYESTVRDAMAEIQKREKK